jgi:hypothetical protein
MNVFFLDRDPQVAAQAHCDKHVVKMILESAQLLSTAHRVLDGNEKGILPDARDSVLYKATHRNHPSAVWVRRELDHYRWVHDLLYFLIGEYRYRYKDRPHATERLLPFLLDAPYNIPMDGGFIMEEPPQCMPDDSKNPDTVIAYRTYYAKHKYSIAKWTRRKAPEWWNEATQRLPS